MSEELKARLNTQSFKLLALEKMRQALHLQFESACISGDLIEEVKIRRNIETTENTILDTKRVIIETQKALTFNTKGN